MQYSTGTLLINDNENILRKNLTELAFFVWNIMISKESVGVVTICI